MAIARLHWFQFCVGNHFSLSVGNPGHMFAGSNYSLHPIGEQPEIEVKTEKRAELVKQNGTLQKLFKNKIETVRDAFQSNTVHTESKFSRDYVVHRRW